MHIASQTCFAIEGEIPQEVYFLLTGCILKESNLEKKLGMKNTYLIEGSIFGETDVMKNRARVESYTTVSDSYILKLSKAVFGELLEEFDDFNQEVSKIAKEREVIRMTLVKAYKSGEGYKLLDDYDIVGSVDNTRLEFIKI